MADEPDSIVLRYLRAMDAKLDRIGEEVREMKRRVGHVEGAVASLSVVLASLSVRLDQIDERVERIERRLDLREVH